MVLEIERRRNGENKEGSKEKTNEGAKRNTAIQHPPNRPITARHTTRAKRKTSCENVKVKNNMERPAHVEWPMKGKPSGDGRKE